MSNDVELSQPEVNTIQSKPNEGKLSQAQDGVSTMSPSQEATPLPDEFIAAEEQTLFGHSAYAFNLPLPPRELAAASVSRRDGDPINSMSRARRGNNSLASPHTRGARTLTRRALGNTARSYNGSDFDSSLPNEDFCAACRGKGHFLCCDGGCLRSFHFECLDPPLELEEVPDEEWFCKECRAARQPPSKSDNPFFSELIYKVDTENPKAFSLPQDIKSFFKNTLSGNTGEFIDSNDVRLPPKASRMIAPEDRDPYRNKDKAGKTIFCYNCNEAPSASKNRKVLSCDFCDQHWHLDCLDPPMTGMPPPQRKWMCPLHSDHDLPKKRFVKQTTVVPVDSPGVSNDGDIIIIPSKPLPRAVDTFEEVTLNRVRYQIPEETIILDFWTQINGNRQFDTGQQKYMYGNLRYGSEDSSLSELTSDLSTPSTSIDTSALDQLAEAAENAWNRDNHDTVDLMDESTPGNAQGLFISNSDDMQALQRVRTMAAQSGDREKILSYIQGADDHLNVNMQ